MRNAGADLCEAMFIYAMGKGNYTIATWCARAEYWFLYQTLYRKVGGLHFVRVGRFGFSFYWSNRSKRTHARP